MCQQMTTCLYGIGLPGFPAIAEPTSALTARKGLGYATGSLPWPRDAQAQAAALLPGSSHTLWLLSFLMAVLPVSTGNAGPGLQQLLRILLQNPRHLLRSLGHSRRRWGRREITSEHLLLFLSSSPGPQSPAGAACCQPDIAAAALECSTLLGLKHSFLPRSPISFPGGFSGLVTDAGL